MGVSENELSLPISVLVKKKSTKLFRERVFYILGRRECVLAFV